MECADLSSNGRHMEGCMSKERETTRIYEPLREKEISKIIATPTPPPPCNDLPSYPSVPFLLHPHRPLLLWCSSSAVHAYDFANNRWEAGGPQQLQPQLQQLHQLPIAAADCICLQCGERSSALRNSSRLSKNHTLLRRRLIPHNDVCPNRKPTVNVSEAAADCTVSAGAANFKDINAAETARSDNAPAIVSYGAASAGGATRQDADFTTPMKPSIADGTPSCCVWVTAGEDKYLHFVEVSSYKLLRSRLQRKKLSAAVFLGSSSSVAPINAPSSSPNKELCITGCSKDNSLQQEEKEQQRPAVQLLVADKFGDVYLLPDSLGAPLEQSLAGDLLSESMRTVPSVHGARVSGAAAAELSTSNAGSSDISVNDAAAATSELLIAGLAATASVVGKPEATVGEHTAAAVVNSSAGPPRPAAVHLSDVCAACQSLPVHASLEVQRRSQPLTTAVVEKGLASQDTPEAAASTCLSQKQQDEAMGGVAGITSHEEGAGVSNPLLCYSAGGHGEFDKNEKGTVVAPNADATSDAVSGTGSEAGIPATLRRSVSPDVSGMADAERKKGIGGCVITDESQPGEREVVVAELRTHNTSERQQEPCYGQEEGRVEKHLQQQQQRREDKEEQMLKQQEKKEEDQPNNTREQRFQNNAWQRERARLWRQPRLSATVPRTQQQQRGEMHTTADTGLHHQKDEEGLLENDPMDIPLLSHLTTITVMKVFPESPEVTDDVREPAVATADGSVQAGAGVALEHAANFVTFSAEAANQEHYTMTSTASSDAATVSDLPDSSSCNVASPRCLRTSLAESIIEAETPCTPRIHVSSSGSGGERADLLLTADRDEKIRICLLDQPWSIESYYLGHSEFVTDFVMIADGCDRSRRSEARTVCGDSNSSDVEEETADAGVMSDNKATRFCQATSNSNSLSETGPGNDGRSGLSETASFCHVGRSANINLQSRKRAFAGKVGISAAADGTLQVWRVSDGAQVDEVLLNPESLFHNHRNDLSHVLSCYEGVATPEPAATEGVSFSSEAWSDSGPGLTFPTQKKCEGTYWRGKEMLPHSPSALSRTPLSPERLLPASLLFDEDQRLILVLCLRLRGLLLIPVGKEQPLVSATTSVVPTRNALLSRQPFFIPFPVVPAAILLVYHSVEELIHTPALAKCARALGRLLFPGSTVDREDKHRSKSDPGRPCVTPSRELTSRDARYFKEQGSTVMPPNQVEGRGLLTASGAIPFVWWIDDMGRLRPPVCTSIPLLQQMQHKHLQQDGQRAEANGVGLMSPALSGEQILPCVEGCSLDVLGTDYGATAARANSVYFWKRTRSSNCPTQAERTARRLRHKHLQQQQQSQ